MKIDFSLDESTKSMVSYLGINVNDVDELTYDIIKLNVDFESRRHIYKHTHQTRVRQGHWLAFIDKYISKEEFDKNKSIVIYDKDYHIAVWDKIGEIYLYENLMIKSYNKIIKYSQDYYLYGNDFDFSTNSGDVKRSGSKYMSARNVIEYFTKHFGHVSKHNNIDVFLYVMRAAWELMDLQQSPISPLQIKIVVNKTIKKLGDKMKYLCPIPSKKYYVEPGYDEKETKRIFKNTEIGYNDFEKVLLSTYNNDKDSRYTVNELLNKINTSAKENNITIKNYTRKTSKYETKVYKPYDIVMIKHRGSINVQKNKKTDPKRARAFITIDNVNITEFKYAKEIYGNDYDEDDVVYTVKEKVSEVVIVEQKATRKTLERALKKLSIYDKWIIPDDHRKSLPKSYKCSQWYSLIDLTEKSKVNYERIIKEYPNVKYSTYKKERSKLKNNN